MKQLELSFAAGRNIGAQPPCKLIASQSYSQLPKIQQVYPKPTTEKPKNMNLETCTAVFKAASFTRAER